MQGSSKAYMAEYISEVACQALGGAEAGHFTWTGWLTATLVMIGDCAMILYAGACVLPMPPVNSTNWVSTR